MSSLPVGLPRLPVVRDGSNGPLIVEILERRVAGRTPEREGGHEEVLVLIRHREGESTRGPQVGSRILQAYGSFLELLGAT